VIKLLNAKLEIEGERLERGLPPSTSGNEFRNRKSQQTSLWQPAHFVLRLCPPLCLCFVRPGEGQSEGQSRKTKSEDKVGGLQMS